MIQITLIISRSYKTDHELAFIDVHLNVWVSRDKSFYLVGILRT